MDIKEVETLLARQLEENYTLLQENNFLLLELIKQNHLIFTITQINIKNYGYHWYLGESFEVKNLRKELEVLQKQVTKN